MQKKRHVGTIIRFLRGALKIGQPFLEYYLPAYNFHETDRGTHLASKNRIRVDTCYAILHEIEARGDYEVSWGLADDGYSDTVRVSRITPAPRRKHIP